MAPSSRIPLHTARHGGKRSSQNPLFEVLGECTEPSSRILFAVEKQAASRLQASPRRSGLVAWYRARPTWRQPVAPSAPPSERTVFGRVGSKRGDFGVRRLPRCCG